jgi:hypothetical protein
VRHGDKEGTKNQGKREKKTESWQEREREERKEI